MNGSIGSTTEDLGRYIYEDKILHSHMVFCTYKIGRRRKTASDNGNYNDECLKIN